jgi:hypothetical protein
MGKAAIAKRHETKCVLFAMSWANGAITPPLHQPHTHNLNLDGIQLIYPHETFS